MKKFILGVFCLLGVSLSQAQQYWNIDQPGRSISWKVEKGKAHHDHIEMAGKRVAVVLRYGVNKEGGFEISKGMVWPMLRTVPNNTHASLMRRFQWNPLQDAFVDGRPMQECVRRVTLDGTLTVESDIRVGGKGNRLTLLRTYMPSVDLPALVEGYRFTNHGKKNVAIELSAHQDQFCTDANKGVDGAYRITMKTTDVRTILLKPGESYSFSASISGRKRGEVEVEPVFTNELTKRKAKVEGWMNNLVLDTPDTVINQMFAFSKIRACESIYETKGGPMHGPGGESFYAAVWANDQAEYINPYFPFIGYDYGNASAVNAFLHFARYMNDEWKPIPSSIIAEGDGYWNGAGDRGDAAMIAYGAARYVMASGSRDEALKLWPLIEWCLEFCRRNINEGGVVASDSDELEGRFPAGKANLCTSSLYYDALLSAAYLAQDLGKGNVVARTYRKQAAELKENIDSYFAANVEGFDTYAYYKGNDVLRSWICIPLTVGIDRRAKGTIDALFSPRLWTDNGLLTQAGTNTFWDRSTLYALRGVFTVGEVEKAMKFLKFYSNTRLLGAHVPYAVEAWPEGGQRHLSAESGLYGRIITEGLFGIRPTGLRSFTLLPCLPQEWDYMNLRKIQAFGGELDIEVVRVKNDKIRITVKKEGKTVMNVSTGLGKPVTCRLMF